MRTIWKFPLQLGRNVVNMPRGAEPLSVAVQHGHLTLWALVDETAPVTGRTVTVMGTGHPFPDDAVVGDFVGTTLTEGGHLVWHTFVEREP